MLYIVSTPIGNLEDITFRAIKTLKEVDLIAVEDTRHSKKLLQKYEIKTSTQSFHAHSDDKKLQHLINLLKEGKLIALISDAGTPVISDPGFVLVNEAIKNGIKVIPIPGASAFLTALSASGARTNQFLYLGFLPQKKGRQTLLQSFKDEKRTIVFYESCHRILKTLLELDKFLGDREIIVARELTKIHEEFFRGTAKDSFRYFSGDAQYGENDTQNWGNALKNGEKLLQYGGNDTQDGENTTKNMENALKDGKNALKSKKSKKKNIKSKPKGEFVVIVDGE